MLSQIINRTCPHIVHLPITCYLLLVLNGAITITTSEPRLIESAVCRISASSSGTEIFKGAFQTIPETACKTDGVQATVAYIVGWTRVWSVVPEALAVTIYAVLAEQKRVDRRVLLTLCGLGTALDDLFRLCIYTNPLVFDIKWIWYRGLLALIGGGERFYKMLATVMIAENVGGREITSIYYALFAASLLVSLAGNAFGAWIMRYNVEATFLCGVWIKVAAAGLPFYISPQLARHRTSNLEDDSHEALLSSSQPEEEELKHLNPSPHILEENKNQSNHNHTKRLLNILGRPFHKFTNASRIPFITTFILLSSLETFSQGVHTSFTAWVSKRYSLTLSSVSFYLLLPKLTGLLNLLILISLTYPSLSSLTSSPHNSNIRSKIALYNNTCYTLGTISLALSPSPIFMVISMILLSGSAGFAETLKSHCTASLKREQINKVYSLLSIFEIVAEVVGGLFWTWVYEWTYGGGGSTVGMRLGLPMWVDASICLGIMVGSVMFFRMRTGGEKG